MRIRTLSKKLIFVLEGFYTILMTSFIIVSHQKDEEKEVQKESSYQNMIEEIYLDINKEFEGDLKSWGANFDKSSLTMTFSRDSTDNPIIMFENGSEQPTPEYKKIIEDFCPRYFNKVKSYLKEGTITEIEINGHTSSEWLKDSDEYFSYMENMKLSQQRSQNVFNVCMASINDGVIEKEKDLLWLFMKKTSANGKSWSDLKFGAEGVEDKEASRRVEFRIITSIESKVEELPSTKL
jgi:flagellar motor protein MotB